MPKQTSIEWLIENLISEPLTELNIQHNDLVKILAKQMHKEEIINSFFEGAYGGDNISGEQYYQETYGGSPKTSDN